MIVEKVGKKRNNESTYSDVGIVFLIRKARELIKYFNSAPNF